MECLSENKTSKEWKDGHHLEQFSSSFTPDFSLLLQAVHNDDKEKIEFELTKWSDLHVDMSGRRGLHIASMTGDFEIVDIFCYSFDDVDVQDYFGNTPLHFAAVKGNLEAMQILINYQADINKTNKEGYTPLHLAVKFNQEKIVKFLLIESSLLITPCATIPNKFADTPLHTAVVSGNEKIISILLKCVDNLDLENLQGKTPLHIAATNGYYTIVKDLLDHGASVEIRCREGSTSLHCAAESGNIEVMDLLLNKGISVNSRNNHGTTPLIICITRCDQKSVKWLIDKEAETAVVDNYISENREVRIFNRLVPLHQSVSSENVEILNILLANGAIRNINDKICKGRTPLYMAVEKFQDTMVEILLKHGSEVNETNHLKMTPLHLAVRLQNAGIVKILLNYGARVDCEDHQGSTVLHYAVEEGNNKIINMLLENITFNMNPDVLKTTIGPLLHIAASRGQTKTVEKLLNNGANVNIRTMKGETPLYLAISSGHLETVSKLLDYKAEEDDIDSEGHSAISYAVENGKKALIELLIRRINILENFQNCDINVKNIPLLHSVVKAADEQLLKLVLICKVFDVNEKSDEGETPLHLAAKMGQPHLVRRLLEKGADPNCVSTAIKCTPLHFLLNRIQFTVPSDCVIIQFFKPIEPSAFARYAEVIKMLLKKGASPNFCDRYGKTPLQYAVQITVTPAEPESLLFGSNKKVIGDFQPDIVRPLLEHGADINSRCDLGHTPIHYAVEANNVKILWWLVCRGADLNITDTETSSNEPPLFKSIRMNSIEMVDVLLESGADADAVNHYDQTTMDIAQIQNTFPKIIELLANRTTNTSHVIKKIESCQKQINRCSYDLAKNQFFPEYDCEAKSLRNILIAILIRRKLAKEITIQKDDFINGNASEGLEDRFNQCELEILCMKASKVGSCGLTLFDIFMKSICNLSNYAGNQMVIQTLKADTVQKNFPISNILLKKRFQKAQQRKILLDSSVDLFSNLIFTNLEIELPTTIVFSILQFLTRMDLENVIKL